MGLVQPVHCLRRKLQSPEEEGILPLDSSCNISRFSSIHNQMKLEDICAAMDGQGHMDNGDRRRSSLFLPGEEEDQSERKLSSLVYLEDLDLQVHLYCMYFSYACSVPCWPLGVSGQVSSPSIY